MECHLAMSSFVHLAIGNCCFVRCGRELLAKYKIKKLHIVGVIACKIGIEHIKANLAKAKLWIGSVDKELTTKSYIVPGLGDAGDLSFGIKE
jgi:uracil phosphoribosyltransferase